MLELVNTVDYSDDVVAAMRSGPPWAPANPELSTRIEREHHAIPGPAGAPEVGLTVFRPKDRYQDLPCLFHIHGGGFVIGRVSDMEGYHQRLVDQLQCCLISVDYRLAPESPFPCPLDDCWAAFSWVLEQASNLQIDLRRIGVLGESAGGGLAAALCLKARDEGMDSIAFVAMVYPMLDDRTCVAADPHPYTGEFIFTPESARYCWSSYLGKEPGGSNVPPYAAPARAEDLDGFPATFISTAALDFFLEENLEFARRLTRAGVSTELHVYPGAFHGFTAWRQSPVAQNADRDLYAFLARGLMTNQQTAGGGR